MFVHPAMATMAGHHIPLVLAYLRNDPYAVTMFFIEEGIKWIFGRDLVIDAFDTGFAGQGDVKLALVEDKVNVLLACTSHPIEMDATDFRHFLAESVKLVPIGDESQYVEIELDRHMIH